MWKTEGRHHRDTNIYLDGCQNKFPLTNGRKKHIFIISCPIGQKSDLWGLKPGCWQGPPSTEGSGVTVTFPGVGHFPLTAIPSKSTVVDQVLPLYDSGLFLFSFPFNDPLIHLTLQDNPGYSPCFRIRWLATWMSPKSSISPAFVMVTGWVLEYGHLWWTGIILLYTGDWAN